MHLHIGKRDADELDPGRHRRRRRNSAPAAAPAGTAQRKPPTGSFWLIFGQGDTEKGIPFPDREAALLAFMQETPGGKKLRVMDEAEWRRVRRGPDVCPGITWGQVAVKNLETRVAQCGESWPHRAHPLNSNAYVGQLPPALGPQQ